MPPKATKRPTGRKRKRLKGIPAKKFGINIRIKTSSGWHKGGVSAGYWASIGRGYLYLAYKTGRTYWIFRNGARAKIAFNDEKQTMKVNTFYIQFTRPIDYKYAKECIRFWARY